MNALAARRSRILILVAAVVTVMTGRWPLNAAASNSFGWKVANGRTAIYLVGSVHMLSKDYYPLNPALETAFNDSDLLVEEADLGEMLSADAQFRVLARGMLPENQSLQRVLSPATYELVNRRVGDLGMPIEVLHRFKPWFLALTLMSVGWQAAGLDPSLGLDRHFYDRAVAEHKQVQGLETTDYQISRFDQMTMEQQDHLLAESITDLDAERSNIRRLTEAWRAGDQPTVEQIVLRSLREDPLMYRQLLVERNRNWLPKLESLLERRGHTIVVVGAAHLVGPDGLIALLKAKGYTIEQL
jgi:uncharacterized protein YbaP (TraB family)